VLYYFESIIISSQPLLCKNLFLMYFHNAFNARLLVMTLGKIQQFEYN